MLKLYNSLSRKKEDFVPLDKKNIRMYACGLTVYDTPHLGNMRSLIVFDLLYRTLIEVYGKEHVTYVRNITDVDDKINKKAVERKITIQELTKEMISYLNADMFYLNNLTPTVEPKATENIDEMISIIQKLIDNGNAYIAEGHVLFDVSSFKYYGKLSGRSIDEMIAGARVEIAPYKKNPMDFVLWKPSLDIDDDSSKFESPWSIGRPGWHIECSAMSHKYLGETFDIHCGGNDLKFPHHENEIAQSCCAFKGSDFAKYWLHVGFLLVDGEKMSKSLGNFITTKDLREKGIKGSVLRYAFLKNHYRKPFDFTSQLIDEAEKNLKDLHNAIEDIKDFDTKDLKLNIKILEALQDDLNTSKVIAELNSFNKKESKEDIKKTLDFLGVFDKSFYEKKGLQLNENEILDLIEKRNKAKTEKNWELADKIRDYLKEKGIELKDSKDKTEWSIL